MTSNLDRAQAFLDALDCKASVWTFQTFDDNADRKSTNLARTYNGTLSEHWDTLTRASQNGAGVFVTINETDGQCRKTANIIRVRAVFVDTDGADIEPIRAAQPHILVESSPGNYHAYWLVSDAPLDEFKGAQKAMIEAWGTDKGVNDLPRVMRLPGFPHQKVSAQKRLTGSPFMVQMVNHAPSDEAHTWAEWKAFVDTLKPSNGLPLSHRASVQNHVRSNEITIPDMAGALQVGYAEIEKALATFSAADVTYDDWIKVGMALCHEFKGADLGLQLWDRWSQSDPRYQGLDDLSKRWPGFREGSDNHVTVRSLLAMAKWHDTGPKLPNWAAGWAYNESLMEFHQITTGHSIKRGAFEAKFNREEECRARGCSASQLVLNSMPTVANTMFWPCDDEIITHRSLDYVNVYRKHDVVPAVAASPAAEAAVRRIVDHAYFLTSEPAEAELLLDFLAYVYQNPDKRVRWAILLFGIQGNGKSFWVELMKGLLGHNTGEVAGTTVSQRFTGWAANKLFICIEEIRVPSESKYAVMDKLKPFISNSEVNIEQKGQDDRVVPNFASYMLLTNHDDALPLDDDDRRYCVIETQQRTKADIPEQHYFDALFGVLDHHIEAVAHYFASRPIDPKFNPDGRAPETSGKQRMMQESKSGPRLAVEEAIVEFNCDIINDDFVYVRGLRDRAQDHTSPLTLPDQRTIARQLKDMGYVKYTIGTKHQGPKIGGKERCIYYRPDRVSPSDLMPLLKSRVTGGPF